MPEAEKPHSLLPVVLGAVLAALPPRLAPSRGFASVCLELATSLAEAWLAARPADAEWTFDPAGGDVEQRLESLVGRDCSAAWWADAAEAAQQEASRRPGRRELEAAPTGLGPMAEARAALAAFLLQSEGGCAAASSSSDRPATPAAARAWASFGALWVVCALEDVVGAVAAHSARKAALVVANRPRTPAGSQPSTAGNSQSAASRPATPASSRPGTPGAALARPGTGKAGGQRQRPAPTERLRLLALKHFVAAAKGDDGLHACPVLETCLVEVATGAAPHVPSAQLMACAPYRERVLRWAAQESEGGGPEALQRAVSEALKTVAASVAPSRPASGGSAARSAAAAPPSPADGGASPASRRDSRASWLPQAFVREFNAEGEEVEEAAADGATEETPAQPPAQAPRARAKGRSGKLSTGAASRATVKVVTELS